MWSTWKHYKTSLKNDKRNTYCTTWNHKKLSSFTQPRAKHDLCFVRMWVMIAWVTLTFLVRGKKRWKWKVTENFPDISKNITRVNNNDKDHWVNRLLHFQLSVRFNRYECMKTAADKSECFLTLAFTHRIYKRVYFYTLQRFSVQANHDCEHFCTHAFFAGIAFYSKAAIKITRTFRKINVH